MARATQSKTIRMISEIDGSPINSGLVQLKRGATTYNMVSVGNGYFRNEAVLPGEYKIFYDSADTNATEAVGAGEVDRLDASENINSIYITGPSGTPELSSSISISNVENLQTELDGKLEVDGSINLTAGINSDIQDALNNKVDEAELANYVPYTGATSDVNLGTFKIITPITDTGTGIDPIQKRDGATKLTHSTALTTIHQALDVQGSATVDSLTTDVGGVTSATNYKLTNLTYNELVKYMYEARPTIVGSGSEDTTIFTSIGTGSNQVNFKLIRNNGGYFDRNLYVEQNQTIGGSQYITGTSRVNGATNYGSRTTEPTGTLVAGDRYYLSVGVNLIGWYTYDGSAWVKDSGAGVYLPLSGGIINGQAIVGTGWDGTTTDIAGVGKAVRITSLSGLLPTIDTIDYDTLDWANLRIRGATLEFHSGSGAYGGGSTKVLSITSTGITTTGSIIKSGGTYSQMLMADGSVQNFAYAGIYVDDGATAQAIATGATYTKLTGFALDQISRNATSDVANDQIVITELGDYDIGYSISYQSGTPNVTFEVGVFGGLTGAPIEQKQIHTDRKLSSSDTGSASGCGLLRVTAVPYYIDLRASHDSVMSVNMTMVSSSLIAKKLGV